MWKLQPNKTQTIPIKYYVKLLTHKKSIHSYFRLPNSFPQLPRKLHESCLIPVDWKLGSISTQTGTLPINLRSTNEKTCSKFSTSALSDSISTTKLERGMETGITWTRWHTNSVFIQGKLSRWNVRSAFTRAIITGYPIQILIEWAINSEYYNLT